MTYENNHCPACGKAFTPQDDIVVCPECGTPHHRACWHALGECVHHAQHGDFIWEPDAPQNGGAAARCPRCGEPCPPDALSCPACGMQLGVQTQPERESSFAFNSDAFLRGVQTDPQTDLGGMTVREAAMLVQYRVPDYMRKFTSAKNTGWNWAAFFFSPFWFFYRKIYKAGALFLGILMVLSVFLSIPVAKMQSEVLDITLQSFTIDENTTPEQINEALQSMTPEQRTQLQAAMMRYAESLLLFVGGLMVPNIAAALTADRLYKKKLIRDVERLREFAGNDNTFRMLALRRGGVSILGLVGCYMIVSLFFELILRLAQ